MNMKMLTSLFLTLLTIQTFGFGNSTFSKSYVESLGLDANDTPLSGSDWQVGYATALSNACDDFNLSTGFYYNSRPEMRGSVLLKVSPPVEVTDYISASLPNCSTATSVLDPYDRANWSNLGIVKETSFNLINKNCGPGITCNDVDLTVNYSTQRLATVEPTEGTDAYKANSIDLFLYNYGSINNTVNDGVPGVGGLADITLGANETKYCSLLRDADSDGVLSSFALRPNYRVDIINWNAFDVGSSKRSGTALGSFSGKTNIYRGIDSTSRFLIEKEISW